jgi:parallel beta-helix repeat protein
MAATWWVDQTDPACSDSGPGAEASPFCTIKAGAGHALAGDSVLVRPGTYREQVSPPVSGGAGAPITYRAAAAGVVILGTQSLSDPVGWAPTATTAWSQPFAPASAPKQVFIDGARLTAAASLAEVTTDSFFHDAPAKILYVDIGGGNPADGHQVEAGARSYGFLVSGKTGIVVEGFAIRGQNVAGVKTLTASDATVRGTTIEQTAAYGIFSDTCTGPLLIDGNTISDVGSVGIRLAATSAATVSGNTTHHNGFSGIVLFGSSNNTVVRNTSYANLRPAIRSAVGIDLDGGSSDNLIEANTTFHNDDSGVQLRNGSNRNMLVRNVSYLNGDHGFDTRMATDNRYVSNTSYGNTKDGFSIEGDAYNTSLADNIAVDNGLTTNENDLYVDTTSAGTFSGDYDQFWNSFAGTTVRFDNVSYSRFNDFRAATGIEPHGIEGDPRFVNPEAGDLHLGATSSPAVDSADASAAGFSHPDHDGRAPIDITTVVDTGAGSPTYADRGAYEFDAPPSVKITVTPASGTPPLAVTVTTAGTIDPDSTGIATYTFDFGDGTIVGPQPGGSAVHTYTRTGVFAVTVTAVDTVGNSGSAQATVTIQDLPPVARLTVTPTSGRRPLPVLANASASTDTDGTPIATYRFDFGDGSIVGPQAGPTASHTYTTAKTFKVTVTVTDTAGLSSTATQMVQVRK